MAQQLPHDELHAALLEHADTVKKYLPVVQEIDTLLAEVEYESKGSGKASGTS